MRVIIAIGVLAWFAGIAWGLQKIQIYSATPGTAAVAPLSWPGSRLVARDPGRATLVMFIHPQCSCTRASLAELDTILEKAGGSLGAWVVVLEPRGMSDDWSRSRTWEAAREMRGVTVVMDEEGTEAARFGGSTSGHVVLYSASGQLAFTGGITAARGHVGDNNGRERILSLVATGSADSNSHEVFGCGLHDPNPRMDDAHDHSHAHPAL